MFLRLLSENPDVALDMMRQLSERLAATTKRLEAAQKALGGAGAADHPAATRLTPAAAQPGPA